jgi:nitroreductase
MNSTFDTVKMNASEVRRPEHAIDKLFLNRWSPRAMSGEPLSNEELMALFEAAKWAPSSYNGQPWRFLYAKRDTADWPLFLNLLVEFNQSWAKNAAVLVAIISRKNFEHNNKPSVTHAFDTGAAWGYLALEGSLRGLVVHGMEGFDYRRASRELQIPSGYEIHAMAAIGKPGRKQDLSPDLQKKEAPSDRKQLATLVCEGKFTLKS